MTKLFDKKAIFVKVEAIYGTDPTPVAADAVEAMNVRWEPLAGGTVTRDLERPYQGADEEVPVNLHSILTFDIDLAGSGTAGTAPPWGALMRACGFSETVTAATSVAYEPVSAGFESVTLHFNQDGMHQVFTGSRGSVSFSANANEFMKATFRVLGRFDAPTDRSIPAVDYSNWQDPLVVNYANTGVFRIANVSAGLESFSFDMRSNVAPRDLPNSRDIAMTARDPGGSVTIEAPALSVLDPVSLARAGTRTTMSLQHGAAGGNIIKLEMPGIQLQAPGTGERDNILNWSLPYKALPGASGNDEVKITVL